MLQREASSDSVIDATERKTATASSASSVEYAQNIFGALTIYWHQRADGSEPLVVPNGCSKTWSVSRPDTKPTVLRRRARRPRFERYQHQGVYSLRATKHNVPGVNPEHVSKPAADCFRDSPPPLTPSYTPYIARLGLVCVFKYIDRRICLISVPASQRQICPSAYILIHGGVGGTRGKP